MAMCLKLLPRRTASLSWSGTAFADGSMMLQIERTGRPSETFYFQRQ